METKMEIKSDETKTVTQIYNDNDLALELHLGKFILAFLITGLLFLII